MREAAQLNRDIVIFEGAGKVNVPFKITETGNVSVAALKKAEKSDDLIIRLAETNGKNGNIKLLFAEDVSVFECDMIEWNNSCEICVNANTAELTFTPFEIKTLRIKKN